MVKHTKILLAIILAGIALRVAGIDFGLPFLCHNDEPVVVNYALAYGRGDFNPHFFKVPPLLSYCLFFLYGIFFAAGKLTGLFGSVKDFGYRFLSDPTWFYIIGRAFTGVFFGSFSVYLIYRLGKRVFGRLTGILSAVFLCFNFLHVRDSHYIYFDIPLVFFVILFFILLHAVHKKDRMGSYILAALVLGTAISVKYSAVILAVPAAAVSISNKVRFRESWRFFVKKNLVSAFAVVIALFVTNPFMFIDHGFFADTLSRMPFFRPEFWYHLRVSLVGGCGLLMCLSSVVGMMTALKNKKHFAPVITFFVVFYYYVLTRSSQEAERYIFPILPLVLMFSAYAVSSLYSAMGRDIKSRVLTGAVCALLLFPSLEKVYESTRLFLAEDTRQESYNWIERNIPPGSTIALDATGPVFPDLAQDRKLIKESYESFNNPKFGMPDGALKYKMELIMGNPYYPDAEYRIYYIKRAPSEDRFLRTYPEIYLDADSFAGNSVEYVILNGILLSGYGKTFIPELEKKAVLVKEFSPYKEGIRRVMPLEDSVTPAAAFSAEELKDRKKFGPVIRVYKMNRNSIPEDK